MLEMPRIILTDCLKPQCPNVDCNATEQGAIRRKHDLIYNQSKQVFPEAAFDAFVHPQAICRCLSSVGLS